MLCNYDNVEMVQAARLMRADAARNAQTEEQFLSVAESTTYDYIAPCDCDYCAATRYEEWIKGEGGEPARCSVTGWFATYCKCAGCNPTFAAELFED